MADRQDSALAKQLKQILPEALLHEEARKLGILKRQRRIDLVALVWVLVFGWGHGANTSLAALQRCYERLTRSKLAASSFHKRLSHPALPQLFQTLWAHAQSFLPRSSLGAFSQLLALDSSFLRLWRGLLDSWPSSNDEQAGARLQMIVNVADMTPNRVLLHDTLQNERKAWKTLGSWLDGALLLVDLGYYDFDFFARVDAAGGFFLSRAKRDCALKVIEVHNEGEQGLVGLKLKEALEKTQCDVLELRVEGSVRRHGKPRQHVSFRALAHRHEGVMRAWLTNAPAERIEVDDAPTLYALRWQVELMFKGLKSMGRLSTIPTRQESIMRVLVLASVLFLLCCGWIRACLFGKEKLWKSSALRAIHVLREASGELLELLIAPRRRPNACSLDDIINAQLARPSPSQPNAFSIPFVVEPLHALKA